MASPGSPTAPGPLVFVFLAQHSACAQRAQCPLVPGSPNVLTQATGGIPGRPGTAVSSPPEQAQPQQ